MAKSIALALAAAVAALTAPAHAAYCGGHPNPNAQPNLFPIFSAAPTETRTAPNGRAFRAGAPGYDFWVIHVFGTAYERGCAHGTLMHDEVPSMINETWAYMAGQVQQNLNFLPPWLAELIANFGLEVALDLTADLTGPFTPAYFFQEMQGLADCGNVDYKTLYRIHLIGSLTQGDCSMYGAWGQATENGKTFQLRALDWDTDGPFKDYPAVLVEHPTDGGHAWASVGFVGWIGGLSGASQAQLAISEIGVSFPDNTFGNESRAGIPFTFLLRDILQWDNSYVDSVNRITHANRTCDLILGVGDGKAGTFRGFEYSYSVANVFDDTNMMPYNNTWHPRFPDIVWWAMDWLCPGYGEPMARQLSAAYGKINAQITISNITAIVQTGDTHIALYDLTDQIMYVSFLKPNNGTGPDFAYDRQFTQLDLQALWNTQAPTNA